jgi:DNA-binding NtrC family response regulator
LRQRPGDIPLLAHHFLRKFAAANSREITGFTDEVLALLLAHSWPGNVRELENAVRRAVTLETSSTIQAESLPDAVRQGAGSPAADLEGEMRAELDAATRSAGAGTEAAAGTALIPEEGLDLEEHLENIRRTHMARALEASGGVQKKAAAKLGMSFRSFRYYLDKLGLRDDGEPEEGAEAAEAAGTGPGDKN